MERDRSTFPVALEGTYDGEKFVLRNPTVKTLLFIFFRGDM